MSQYHIDETLQEFATPEQWETYCLYCELGSYETAGERLGRSKGTVYNTVKRIREKALRAGYTPDGYKVAKVTTITGKGGKRKAQSVQVTEAGGDPDYVTHIPDPKHITKTTTLFDRDRRVEKQWVMEKPELVEREKLWQIAAKELAAKVERAEPIPAPDFKTNDDLLACYPVGDHHLGMKADKEETGSDDYDVPISEGLLRGAAAYLIGSQPAAKNALIAFLGDFLHYDSVEPVTPTSKNPVDAATRVQKMFRAGLRAMRHLITAALERHQHVHVIVEIGNHDLTLSPALMESLAAVYENEPRVSIDTGPGHYHYYRFGKVLIGTHHGHGGKPDKLPLIMAADRSKDWGETDHRYWWTGHVHNKTSQDFIGCSVESFRILAPVDAWAGNKGYRPIRSMQSILIHREFGEIGRYTVTPEMIKMLSMSCISPG
jgi:hypothetical protein